MAQDNQRCLANHGPVWRGVGVSYYYVRSKNVYKNSITLYMKIICMLQLACYELLDLQNMYNLYIMYTQSTFALSEPND